ncbi:unnamed protein product, partial [marine sediment metagenome]
EQILHDLGYNNVEVIGVGFSERKLLGLLKIIKRLSNNAPWFKIISAFRIGLTKLNALDKIERMVQKIRAVELVKGTANKLYTKAIKAIDEADDYNTLNRLQLDWWAEPSGHAKRK